MREKGLGVSEVTYSTVFTAIKNSVDQRYDKSRSRESFAIVNRTARKLLASPQQAKMRQEELRLQRLHKLHPDSEYTLPDVTVSSVEGESSSLESTQLSRDKALGKLLSNVGDKEATRALIDEALSQNLPLTDQLFLPMLILLARHGNKEGAKELLLEARKLIPRFSPEFYAAVLKFYVSTGDAEAVAATIEDMKKDGLASSIVYSEALKAYAFLEDEVNVEVILTEMAGRGWQPDVGAYQALISMYLRTKSA